MTPKAKILIVDDEIGTRDILQQILKEMKYDVQAVANGYKAIEIIKEEKFDVLITDIRMPGIDGLSVLEVAKKIDPDIEVIMITAYASLKSAIEALRDGAADYLMKPINIDELKATLRNALGKQMLTRENRALLKSLKEAKEESDHWAYAVGVIYRLSENLRYHHDFREIAQIVLDYLSQVVDFHLGTILLLIRKGGKVVIKVNADVDPSLIDETISNLLKEVNSLTHREVKLEELSVDVIKGDNIELKGEKREVKASFILPLTLNETVIGGINVVNLERDSFGEVDQKTIYAVASQTALAIESHKR